MPAIPTVYAGIQFRSRIEARWAALFDCLDWKWEYEPFDADGYIPDFVLLGDRPVLVEVKADLTLKELQQHVEKIETALEGNWSHDILIVGAMPIMGPVNYWANELNIGWLGERFHHQDTVSKPCWSWDEGVWITCGYCGLVTFCHSIMSYAGRICGHYDGDSYMGRVSDTVIKDLWKLCCNTTAWNSPYGQPDRLGPAPRWPVREGRP